MKRISSIDFIKFIAMFFIVYIHSHSFKEVDLFGIEGDRIDFLIDTFARFGVPFFFMVSGYLVVKQVERKGGGYFPKYVGTLIHLYVAWFLFFFLYDLVMVILDKGFKSEPIIEYISTFLTFDIFYYGAGHTQYHLWYLLAATWAMILFALFYYFGKIELLLVVSFILYVVGLFDQSYSGIYDLSLESRDGAFFGIFYITLGGIFGKYQSHFITISRRFKPWVWALVFIGFSLLQVVEREITAHGLDGNSGNYFISTILVAVTLFMFIFSMPNIGEESLVNKIGKNTVGIYVIHTVIMDITNRLVDFVGLSVIREHLLWGLLFTPYLFIVSYLIYMSLQRLKPKFG
ncbi:acyltransferase [Halobacillus shinanisalinarum]|uniref:Acyltransferase n=1 Tax=Halobacillus shinanisalinarum TaxID=2932258 RepID=A0ABY4H3L0_9BACI|nr:acyltransferase [Halobacillus shinanisalinarum]UOQ94490.1 acyltransferase [Halobacillus shinanisalinarum]